MPQNKLQKHGIVQAFNVSPKGVYEGLLLEHGGEVIQINFPREHAEKICALAPEGAEIQVDLEPEAAKSGIHEVYRLVSLTNGNNERFPPAPGAPNNGGHFSGKVQRLNFALHGEVNGAILDTGDFIHVRPHGAAALHLTIGINLKGRGAAKPKMGGGRVIEAEEVNGIRLDDKPKPKKKAHK